MKRQHPLLSPTGIVLTIILVIILALLLWQTGGLMFNPGALTAQGSGSLVLGGVSSHAEITECSQCHQPLAMPQSELCMACHTDTRQEIALEGLHGRIPSVDRCFDCHPDHKGDDFDVVLAGTENFNHGITDFNLIQHQFDFQASPLECSDCHPPGDFDRSSVSCTECHAADDPIFVAQHASEFGSGCVDCHDGIDRMTAFDHQSSMFPLEGEHTSLVCAACHSDSGFEETPKACAACHSEPEIHLGVFDTNCAVCHSPMGWLPADLEGQAFDHKTTSRFDLIRHSQDFQGQNISCATCHTENLDKFTSETCVACHAPAEPVFMMDHQALFGPGCLDCHDGVDRMHDFSHDQVFAIDGRHAEVECTACHAEYSFSGTPTECSACHTEPEIHAGVFGLACESCHSTIAWTPAVLRSHEFPLDHGGEGEISCLTCHPTTYIQYTCDACHAPAEMQEEHADEDIFSIIGRCVDCHPTGLEDER